MHFVINKAMSGDLAYLGFLLIEIGYLPQIIRLYRVKEAHEFHILYPVLNIVGRLCGFTAGLLSHNASITWGFLLGILVRSVMLSQVCYYRHRESRARQLRLEQVSV